MKMLSATFAICILAVLLPAPRALAQSYETVWPPEEPVITSAILSRTSMTVKNIEESLKLYRDIFGLEPFYERAGLDDARLAAFSGLAPGQTMRLVVLRSQTDAAAKLNAGYLGLSEIHNADGTAAQLAPPAAVRPTSGAMAMLVVVRDVLDVHRQVEAAGYDVLSAPMLRDNGSLTQLLMRGPDGERLWVTQGAFPTAFIQKKDP